MQSNALSDAPTNAGRGHKSGIRSDSDHESHTRAERSRYWTMAVFLVLGLIHASWSVNLPVVRDRFSLNSLQLSIVMFVLAAGAIATSMRVGPWLEKVGLSRAYTTAGIGVTVSAILILLMPDYWATLTVLSVFGMTAAAVDVAMNTEANRIERILDRPVMSSLHGMCSVGGIVGGAVGGILITDGIAPLINMIGAALLTLVTLLAAGRCAVSPPPTKSICTRAVNSDVRSRRLWGLGMLALVGLIAEGAMYNWTVIYMHDVVHSSPSVASLGYAAFTGGMAISRFAGDAIRRRIGDPRLMRWGAALACFGMTLALLIPNETVAIVGFATTGLGLANMMPLLFAAAARVEGVSSSKALAKVAGMGYIGVLAGPVVVGGFAQLETLPVALSVVAICSSIVAIAAPRMLDAGSADTVPVGKSIASYLQRVCKRTLRFTARPTQE